MTLRTRLAALERRHPRGVVIVFDEADRDPGDDRPWRKHDFVPGIVLGYARRGESAKDWAARVGWSDPKNRPLARLPYLRG